MVCFPFVLEDMFSTTGLLPQCPALFELNQCLVQRTDVFGPCEIKGTSKDYSSFLDVSTIFASKM